MAGTPVTIIGVMTGKDGTSEQVTITGLAATPGLDVGMPLPQPLPPGTVTPPIYYPPGGVATPPIYHPPGIWGPTDPRPTPPIYIPPTMPPGVATPPIYYPPVVSPPIALPEPTPPPVDPPIAPPGGGLSEGWQWFYAPGYGFVLIWLPPGGGGKPVPPGGSGDAPVATPYKK